ncbi:protein rolling stone [Exaiptasia diaphana]|uniref:Protein rolling stone n=1 Tax=Exaiptasia diaphana TaxID=2652724 RepID=A0A913XNH2_EXADI|nr:protein rolling stone [Exaiptasia diaphana]
MALRDEFRISMFKLNHDKARDFAESPWMPWYLLAVLRLIFAAYCTGWIIASGFFKVNGGAKWFIFLTNWGYFFVSSVLILASVVTLWYHCKGKNQVDLPTEMKAPSDPERENTGYIFPPRWHHKTLWVLYSIGANIGIAITILYWSLLAANYTGAELGLDISTHALNSVFMVLDILLSSMPVRIFHMVYPMAFSIVYMIFTIIFWAAEGTNPVNHKRYIYSVLDYSNNPGLAVGLCLGLIFVGVPLIQLFIYGLYRLREFVVGKLKS